MDWFTTTVELGAVEAAWFAQGMRKVAQADGVVHEREMNLIASFEAGIGDGAEGGQPELSDELRVAYVRSLVMVALADGVVSDVELACIGELAAEVGFDEARVEEEVLAVKRRFLSVFAGVSVFRDAVVRVAEDMGLPAAEVDALRQEA